MTRMERLPTHGSNTAAIPVTVQVIGSHTEAIDLLHDRLCHRLQHYLRSTGGHFEDRCGRGADRAAGPISTGAALVCMSGLVVPGLGSPCRTRTTSTSKARRRNVAGLLDRAPEGDGGQ